MALLNSDDFLADAYAALPVAEKLCVCMVCGERFATVDEIVDHVNVNHPSVVGL